MVIVRKRKLAIFSVTCKGARHHRERNRGIQKNRTESFPSFCLVRYYATQAFYNIKLDYKHLTIRSEYFTAKLTVVLSLSVMRPSWLFCKPALENMQMFQD